MSVAQALVIEGHSKTRVSLAHSLKISYTLSPKNYTGKRTGTGLVTAWILLQYNVLSGK